MAEKIGDISSASVKMILEPDKEKLFHFLGFTHPHEWKSDISNVSVLNNSLILLENKNRNLKEREYFSFEVRRPQV